MTADPLADRYVVRNIAALMALDIAPGSAQDRRISKALVRRDSRRAGEDASQ